MRSMTGFGRATVRADGREITIEMKSVNHRFLDLNIRLPRTLSFLEEKLRAMTGGSCERGHIDIFVTYRNDRKDAKTVQLDESLATAYAEAFEKLAALTDTDAETPLCELARMPDVFKIVEAQEDQDAVWEIAKEAFSEAVRMLVVSRETEGGRLRGDMFARLAAIEAALCDVESNKIGAEAIRQKLMEKIETLLGETPVDPARIAQEAAILADRAAIDEETVRLAGHIEEMRETLEKNGPQGRRLEFITQEMNRETNTIGSKSAEMSITRRVIEIKGELEKIREQIQNIE